MSNWFIIFFAVFINLASHGQVITVENIIDLLSTSEQKQTKQLLKKGFKYQTTGNKQDGKEKFFNLYEISTTNKELSDTIQREIIVGSCKGESEIIYQSTSIAEVYNLKHELKNYGFYSSEENDTGFHTSFYQHLNNTAKTYTTFRNGNILYSIKFHQKIFPDAKDMYYADDLLHFTSHEYLAFYFGEENVKKDIYFFEGNEISKCSVLFAGTTRQVVFIWEDDTNKRTISNLLLGGQQKLKSVINKDNFIAESSWLLKSGLYAGMPLYELRKLNDGDLKFYAGNSINTGLVLEDNRGNLNFKKEKVILGCINCKDDRYRSASILNVDKAIEEGRILFVLSVIISPAYSGDKEKSIVEDH